jgi:hypothetical protein
MLSTLHTSVSVPVFSKQRQLTLVPHHTGPNDPSIRPLMTPALGP